MAKLQPMLAATCTDTSKLTYPKYLSPKLDGIRCLILNGVAYSRSMKPIRNTFIQNWVANNAIALDGLDGELIVGSPTAEDVFRVTTSGVMSTDGEPDFKFYVFDKIDSAIGFASRYIWADKKEIDRVVYVDQTLVSNEQELLDMEHNYLLQGYEGAMLKSPNGLYKYGRATEKEGTLLKVKRFVDSEFEIVGFEEKMHNENEATKDELGHTTRSTSKEGLVPADTLGALIVKTADGQTFGVGSGFDDATRKLIWENREQYIGKLVKVKYFPIGVKDLPRFPVFLGIRSKDDL